MCTETLCLYRCGHLRGGSAARRHIEPCGRVNVDADTRAFEHCPRFRIMERRHTAHACPECRGTKVDGFAARLQQNAAERAREMMAARSGAGARTTAGAAARNGGAEERRTFEGRVGELREGAERRSR